MGLQQNFTWPVGQDIILGIQVAPPTAIFQWTLEFDLLYKQNSPQPIYSAFNLSGTIIITNGATGQFQVPLYHSLISGFDSTNAVLNYTTRRIDSGNATDICGGMICLTPF